MTFAKAYADAKRAAGAADFGDLINWSRRLLAQPDIGAWIRYKLDQRTDHILVDEAQDTNAAQWDIITAMADEYAVSAVREADQVGITLQNEVARIAETRLIEWSASIKILASSMKEACAERKDPLRSARAGENKGRSEKKATREDCQDSSYSYPNEDY